MEKFSALLAICAGNSPVTGEFPSQRPVTRSFDVFFELHLNQRLSKQSRRWWFETLTWSLWRHCNGFTMKISYRDDRSKNRLYGDMPYLAYWEACGSRRGYVFEKYIGHRWKIYCTRHALLRRWLFLVKSNQGDSELGHYWLENSFGLFNAELWSRATLKYNLVDHIPRPVSRCTDTIYRLYDTVVCVTWEKS